MAYQITDECIACGVCLSECPSKAISEGDPKYKIDTEKCNNDGKCAEVCPVDACKKIE